jgi:hypothetical protein
MGPWLQAEAGAVAVDVDAAVHGAFVGGPAPTPRRTGSTRVRVRRRVHCSQCAGQVLAADLYAPRGFGYALDLRHGLAELLFDQLVAACARAGSTVELCRRRRSRSGAAFVCLVQFGLLGVLRLSRASG